MDAIVRLEEGMRFDGTADSGHHLTMDSGGGSGGTDAGLRPMELLLIGLAGCTAMDVLSILRKKRQDVTAFEVRANGVRADEHPRIFTDIELEFVVTGRNVDPKAVERSIQLSSDVYCSAQAMLNKAANITTSYRIIETEA